LTGTPSEADNWVTRYDGTFAAHPVTPGRIRALVRHPAYVEGLSDLVTLTAGGVAEVKITLRAGGSLEGVVVDRYGRPIGGMRVELSANTGSRTVATYTADDGAFAFAALPSEVTITVARGESPDRPVVRERITVREGKRESVRIVVPEARDAVECLVVDERGDPIEGAEVVFASLDANSPLRQTRFTGADGRVTMDDTRGLELSVTVESPGYAPAQERFGKAPERVRVVLKHGVKITGRVTSVRGRVLVAQARVTVVSQGRRRVTTTNADGVWQMPDVPAGPIQLVVEGPSLPSVELERNVERQARLDRPFDLGDVDLPEAGGVSGVVVDGRGTPVPGARVSTQPLGSYAPLMAQSSGSVVTDASGNFRLAPVAIGKVTVYAIAEGVGQGRSEPVEIQRDRDRDGVKIQLLERVADEGAVPTGSSVAITLRAAAAGITTIASVAPGSEAERAGLRTGDELLAIDGVTPRDLADARQRLSGPENQDVLVEIQRQGQRFKVRTVREPVRR
jgi:protocatechuate 3,4-dioxygenase beta subunit